MQRELYFEVTTMGHFSERPALVREDKPVEPGGCHWFGSCGDCRWEDCIVNRPVGYATEKGKRLRGAALAGMLQAGMPVEWLAEFFGIDEELLLSESKPYAGGQPTCRRNSFRDREEMMAEAVRRRLGGESEMGVANDLGVSPRQVRRWFQRTIGDSLPSGVRRTNGNQWRGHSLAPGRASVAIQRRCDVVRCAFE